MHNIKILLESLNQSLYLIINSCHQVQMSNLMNLMNGIMEKFKNDFVPKNASFTHLESFRSQYTHLGAQTHYLKNF